MGASAIFMEDQVAPKRCGHMAGKDVIPAEQMVAKIRAAVGRAAQHGLLPHRAHRRARRARPRRGAAPRRAVSRRPAPTACSSRRRRPSRSWRSVGRAFQGVPQIANMVEGGGQTPVLPPAELQAAGLRHGGLSDHADLPRRAHDREGARPTSRPARPARRRRRGLRRLQGHHRLRELGARSRTNTRRRTGGAA